ncbi:hypothetical protein SSYIS1_27720 [Serratia symbiotica]|uniref:Uncharacterized protein n=1 Tax=Serratia symbiotica TaxID=138074 RepID=A0A455VIL5_9GAMM|nr:hypothetical protein SSYIS1_27720 [Serratia symbiotica]
MSADVGIEMTQQDTQRNCCYYLKIEAFKNSYFHKNIL